MSLGTLVNGHYQNQKPLWLMLPESAAREILSFNDKLNNAERADDGSLTIEVNRVFPDRRIRKAVAFLLSDSLAAITGSAMNIRITLIRLVELYKFSLDLSIPKLENAIIDHIKNSPNFTIQRFIDLAASYLDSRPDARTTSLGRFLESHLKESLQSAAEIEGASYNPKLKTGGLGKVYFDLLEEDRKEHWKQVAKRSAAARA